jgi:hypothetical protein
MLKSMSQEPSTRRTGHSLPRWLRNIPIAVARLILVGFIFGVAYNWALPLVYAPDSNPGFWLGAAHGALMPIALPSLLAGKDVPIYSQKNQGRRYKLGYIAGINVCGFIFFGLSFWQPGRPDGQNKGSESPAGKI